jgi:hypothetical protein
MIFGENDADKQVSGPGDVTLQGGPGADKFNCRAGQDTGNDFNAGEGDVVLPNCEAVFFCLLTGSKPLVPINPAVHLSYVHELHDVPEHLADHGKSPRSLDSGISIPFLFSSLCLVSFI